MTKKEQILKLMSRSARNIDAGSCIAQLNMNHNTARGRLSNLCKEGLVAVAVPGIVGWDYTKYRLTAKGRAAANLIAVPATAEEQGPFNTGKTGLASADIELGSAVNLQSRFA